jgi:hypothetical protein
VGCCKKGGVAEDGNTWCLVARVRDFIRRGMEGRGLTGLRKDSSGQALSATTARFGVRQLAAALARARLLSGNDAPGCKPREQARGEESGSKLPHSKAPLRMTAETSISAACSAPEATQFQGLKAHSTPRLETAGLKPRPSKGHKQYRLLMQPSTRPRY